MSTSPLQRFRVMFWKPRQDKETDSSDNGSTAQPGDEESHPPPVGPPISPMPSPMDVGGALNIPIPGLDPGQPSLLSPQSAGQAVNGSSSNPRANGSDAQLRPETGGNVANVLALVNAPSNNDGLDDLERLFLRRSPAGFHVTNISMFMRSPLKPPPTNGFQLREAEDARRAARDDSGGNPQTILKSFNYTHKNEKICRSCLTWFRVGENVFQNPTHFDAFRQRLLVPIRIPPEMIPLKRCQREGYCGPVCEKIGRRRRSAHRLRQICDEVNEQRHIGWRRILFLSKIVVAPEGIVVRPANETDQGAGMKIVFLARSMLEDRQVASHGAFPGSGN